MTSRKLSVALAALLLGAQLGSAAVAAISDQQIAMVESLVANGQVEELTALLAQYPELLEIQGALGEALRAFAANPTAQALQAVAALATGGQTLAALAATGQIGTSIY